MIGAQQSTGDTVKLTNKDGLPEGLVRAMLADPYDAGDSDITASTLADPPLLQALKRKYWDQLEEDAAERVWALLGQAAHVVAERGSEKLENAVLSETRYAMTVNGWKLSGAMDHFDISKGILTDYKVTSAWTIVYGDRQVEWEKQLNTLAHLIEMNTVYKVSGIEIVAILRDWSARDLERSPDRYPKQAVVVIPLTIWPKDKRQKYIEQRVKLHKNARELLEIGHAELIQACTDEERWMKKDKKTGAKTFTRCEKYCAPARFCPQLAREREHKDGA